MANLMGVVRWRDTKEGVPGAEVTLLRRGGGGAVAKTKTNDKGKYRLDNIKEGTGYTVRAVAEGPTSAVSAPFEVSEGNRNRKDIALDRSSVSTKTTATTATTSTTSTDTRTTMGTTATITTDTTSSTVTTGTTASTATSATSATSATTATVAPSTSSGPPAAATSFDDLVGLVAGTKFDVNPAVSIDEARQFRRLYTIANYTLARVPGAISALNALLNTSTPPGGAGGSTLPLVSKQALIDKHQATIDSILARASDNTRTEADLLMAVRAQFDLGTAAVPSVNTAFKGLFREFVGLCANDLLGVDPQAVTNQDLSEQQKKEELNNFLKRTKRALLRLVENASIAGTLGSGSLVDKWSRVLKDSIDVLSDVGNFVGDDDADRKHIWSIVAELNRSSKAAYDAYVVHAREGGSLISDAIEAYQQLSTKGDLTKEDQSHMRDLFFDAAKYGINGETISARLRRNALLIQENWIAAWN